MMSLQCDVNTTESLQKLRERNELCDVVLVSSDGKQTLAHSCVLASHSSVIATVLQSRLAAEHDWSILRPLVININEVSVKDSVKEDSEGNMSIIEILISLMYGEIVNIATTHVRALNAYAHVLGLSDQIFACLEGVENRSTKDIKNKGGKKNIRTASKSNENEYEHIEVLSEISLENQIFPTEIPKSSQVKESDNSTVVQTYGIGENPDNVLSLSLSPEGQEEVDAFGKAWQEGTLSYEKPADIQGQECNIVVCKMDQDSMDKIDGAHGKNPAESAVLNITLTDQSNTNSFCGVTQPVHQPKKQPKKSFICSACNSAFQKCCDLVKHVQSLQHFTVQCPLCFTQIEDAESQRIHFAEHDQELPFFCIYCNLRFRTRAALTMHTPKHMTMKPEIPDEPSDEINGDRRITYRVVDGATQRAKRMLVDSKGYTYTVKRHKDEHTYWCCALRTKYKRCRATVSQDGNSFKVGGLDHCHEAKQGNVASRILSSKIKEEACKDFNASASTIVDKVVSQCVNLENPVYDMLLHNNLIRKANRVRQKMKQDSTPNLDFELNDDFMPSMFMKKDLRIGNERHLIFATNAQLELMSMAKIWYLDGNCSLHYQPFLKIFAIYTFINSGDEAIMVPLAYVMMSRCSEKDYKEVFSALLDQLPHPPRICKVIPDFEKALWRAVLSTFPDITPQGCAFHWGKSVWRKAQKLGIKTESLREDEWQQNIITNILSLPLFPPELIESAHSTLCEMVTGHRKFETLLEYIGSTWISSTFWDWSSWSNFMHPLRMRDDVEGWHHRLIEQLNQVNPVFYNILWLLIQESENIPVDFKVMSEEKLKKYQRKDITGNRSKIFSLWDSYISGTTSCSFLFKKFSLLYCPEIVT